MFYSLEIKHSFIGSPGGLTGYNSSVDGNCHSGDKLAFQKQTAHALSLSCCSNVSISWLVLLGFYVKTYAERIQVFYILLHLIQSKRFKSTFLIVTISVVPQFPFLFSHTIKYESK